jgi:type 1 glutamine amidotransferase
MTSTNVGTAFCFIMNSLPIPEDEQVKEWMDAQVSRQIERYVREGGSWLAWHSGLASYPEDGEYVRMLSGSFEFHPDQHQVTRYTPSAGIGGGPSFAFLDEHYFVRCAEEEIEIFLRSESVDGTSIAGWRHNFGFGRVCCLSPTHRLEGLMDPDFMETLYNCVKWCVRES